MHNTLGEAVSQVAGLAGHCLLPLIPCTVSSDDKSRQHQHYGCVLSVIYWHRTQNVPCRATNGGGNTDKCE